MIDTATTVPELRSKLRAWRAAGQTIALVPTMGALHAGHLSLVEAAKAKADRVVVSIFVNPTQFGPNEDLSRYPRPLAQDLALLGDAGADMAWTPTVEAMYPQGFATKIQVSGITEMLDGTFRPGHFEGVATVVAKLLLQVAPDVALFGEKDYQQLCVIKQLVADLNIATEILGVPTVREADGLALSSRNQYLSAAERALAPRLYAILTDAARHIAQHPSEVNAALAHAREAIVNAGFAKLDYLELRTENTLQPVTHFHVPARLLVAAWMGTTRLIDNLKLEQPHAN